MGRAGGDGLSEPSALAGTTADCHRIQGVVEQWAAPMGRLPCYDELPADRTGKAARSKAGQGRENVAAVDGEVIATGDGAGIQGRLQDRTSSRRLGGRDRGWGTQYAPPMGISLSGGGPGVPLY